MEIHDKKIAQAYAQLPQSIKVAVDSFPWDKVMSQIGNENHLQIDEADAFRKETLKVVMGLEDGEEYRRNLIYTLNINGAIADSLMEAADLLIFNELQRLSYSHRNESTDHVTISDEMQKEGVVLLDQNEDMTVDVSLKPDTSASTDIIDDELDTDDESKELSSLSQEDLESLNDKKANSHKNLYHEEISAEDLLDIFGNPISVNRDSLEEKTPVLQDILHNKSSASKVDSLDASPSKAENIIDEGNYFNHLKENKNLL